METLPLCHTPCIGLCSTVYGDDICRGCRRFSDEVVRWNGLSSPEKLTVLDRLGRLIEVVILDKIERIEEDLLKSALSRYSIRYYPQHHPYTWVYSLMRSRGEKLLEETATLEDYGIFLKPSVREIPLRTLLEEMDEELYLMSETVWVERKKGYS